MEPTHYIPHYWFDAEPGFRFIMVEIRDQHGRKLSETATVGLGRVDSGYSAHTIERVVQALSAMLMNGVCFDKARQISGGTLN